MADTLYYIYRLFEFIIFISYLFFIFISIQIWYLWKNIDIIKLKSKIFSDSLIQKSYIYVFFSFSIFMIHEFIEEEMNLMHGMVYEEFFEMLALLSLLLFANEWYRTFKACSHEKSVPEELLN